MFLVNYLFKEEDMAEFDSKKQEFAAYQAKAAMKKKGK